MDFDLLKRKIINNKFSLSYRNGEKLYEENKAEVIDVKEIDNISNIYGRVTDGRKVYSTFIKSDSNGRALKLSCNCEIHEEARKSGSNFACSHLIATILELTKRNNIHKENNKDEIELSILLEENYKDDYLYNISLFIKDKSRIRINTKVDLEYHILNDKAVYSFKRVNYSKNDKALIKMLSKLNMKVKDEDLREVLFLCRYKKVQAKIKSMQYNTEIIMKDMPLKFTLKVEQNKIKLQRRKDTIIALNKDKTAFIFNEEIYIPPFKQCKSFNLIYSILKDKYYTYVNKSSLKKVISVLSEIGELSISDEVKNILAKEADIDLYFYKEDEKIYCEFLNKEYYIRSSAKLKNIEEILFIHGFTKQKERYLFTRNDDSLFELLKSEIVNMCNIKSSKALGNLSIISKNKFKGKIKKESDDLFFELDFLENDEINSAIENFRNSEKFYRFKDYSFLDFTREDIRDYMKFLSFIDYKGDPLKIDEGYEEIYYEEGNKLNFLELVNRDKKEKDIVSPKGLKAELKSYQLEGVRWIQNKKENNLFGILADEMGLGKTLQTIAFLMLNKGQKSMVIAPTSLIYNWESEFKKFAPKLKIACIHGDKKKREKLIYNISDYDVVLTSYGTINMDIDLYSNIKFDNLIIDEGQTIKNPKSKVTLNVKKIKADFNLVLTGTPIENNLMELWSIFDFLRPGYLFSEGEFKRKFLKTGDNDIKFLKLLIKQFILRRTKKDVLSELPDKKDQTVYVTMEGDQKKIYKNSINVFKKEAKNLNDTISILALLTKLREIALDPHLINENYKGKSAKTEKFMEIIKDTVKKEKKKVLVFSQFTGMLDIIKTRMDKEKIGYYYLDGSTKASERVKLCNEFNKKKRTKVFLISLKAGGTGLNLTSAEKVIHIDPWWNPAVENQATDRAHRIGQKNEVDVIKLITKGTIEEKIMILKEEKSKMISELLDDNENINMKNTLTKEEIEYLLTYDDV